MFTCVEDKNEKAAETSQSEIAKPQYHVRVVILGLRPTSVSRCGVNLRVEAHMSLSFGYGSQGTKLVFSEDEKRKNYVE